MNTPRWMLLGLIGSSLLAGATGCHRYHRGRYVYGNGYGYGSYDQAQVVYVQPAVLYAYEVVPVAGANGQPVATQQQAQGYVVQGYVQQGSSPQGYVQQAPTAAQQQPPEQAPASSGGEE